MNTKLIPFVLCIITILFLTNSGTAAPDGRALETAFTYQGRLDHTGTPYTGSCDFQFNLWDAEADGSQAGSTLLRTLPIVNGLFSVKLDFGSGIFTGDAYWLEVEVQCPGDSGPTTFPRQELTATPYALYASTAPWSGITGKPAGFSDNVDDDTTYFSGAGLTQTDTTFSIDPTYTQRRISGSCGVGSTIHVINEDGSVTCGTDGTLNRNNPPEGNRITTLAGAGNTNYLSTVTIGMDGLGLFAYFDSSAEDLMVAHCEDLYCSSATFTHLDTSGTVGSYSSVSIGADGLGLISYISDSAGDLKVAHCTNLACTNATINTIDSVDWVGQRTSSTIGADGLGLISYYDHTHGTLKVAHCVDVICSSANTYTLDTVGNDTFVGSTSIATGWDGLGIISYYNISEDTLHVAHCSNINCSTASIVNLDVPGTGQYNSLVIGTDGMPLISYINNSTQDLKVAHCSERSCISWTTPTLDSAGSTGWYSSITIGTDGMGIISYMRPSAGGGTLSLARCNDIDCTSATIIEPDSSSNITGVYTAITIGVDGMPLIVYRDHTTGGMKVVHCASIVCTPYFHRR